MERILVKSDKYDGKYIAMIGADNNTIVGAGNTPGQALNEARKKGVENPFLIYIPYKDLVHIYYAG